MLSASVRQLGFTLLETIVALALLGSVGIALFAWINTSLGSLVRVEEAIEREAATRVALEYLGTVNPMLQADGAVQFGRYTVTWRSAALEGPVGGIHNPSRLVVPSRFQLALFDTRVSIKHPDMKDIDFSLRQVGYRRVLQFGAESGDGE